MDGIAETYAAEEIKVNSYTNNSFKALLQNGYNFKRSGDVLFRFNVAYFDAYMQKGTTHGAEFSYDTHVPLLFMGWGLNQEVQLNLSTLLILPQQFVVF